MLALPERSSVLVSAQLGAHFSIGRLSRIVISVATILLLVQNLHVLAHGGRTRSVDLVFEFSQLLLLQFAFLFKFLPLEGSNARGLVLRLRGHEPVVLVLNLLDAASAPSGHPVVRNLVEDQTTAALARGQATLLTELLPLGLLLFLGSRLLTRQHSGRNRESDGLSVAIIFENLSIFTMLGVLRFLDIVKLAVKAAQIIGSAARKFC
jgi:hypothetical protein